MSICDLCGEKIRLWADSSEYFRGDDRITGEVHDRCLMKYIKEKRGLIRNKEKLNK